MYDVIIVGAGPAGSTCARECAKRGLKTLLLDKDGFPRPKPCAGAVSESALSFLDFPLPSSIIEKECFGVRVHFQGRTMEVRKDCRIAVLVSRDKFDSYLLDKAREAGARFMPNEKVEGITAHRESVEVSTASSVYRALYVIGADGVQSRVAKEVRRPFKNDEVVAAVVGSVAASNRDIDGRLGGSLEMHFGIIRMGYGWIFPHDGYYSVGIMGLASAFSRPGDALSDFARSAGMEPANTRGHLIPFGGVKRKIASGRILLAGDAAGFADPFHGEGISHALLSGRLAAREISEIVRNGGKKAVAFSRYRKETERLIRKNLRVALCLARSIDAFPSLFRRLFLDNREALEKYLDIPAGRLDYKRFWKWLAVRAPFYLLSSVSQRHRRNGKIIKDAGLGQ